MSRARVGSAWLALACTAAACADAREEPRATAASGAPPQAAPSAAAQVWFSDVTAEWGLDFVHDAGLSAEKHLPETMGAGAALADLDADGDLDVYLVQGGPMRLGGPAPGSFREPPGPLPVNRLFAGQGGGRLRDVTAASGAAAHTGYGMGVACADADGDGRLDLYVTNLGADVLLLGDGRLAFGDGTAAAGLEDGRWTSAASFFDADGDGDLDLYVCAYVEVDLAHPIWCGGREPGQRSACHPDTYAGLPDRFWRNDGRGRFHDATQEAGLAASSGKGLGVVSVDFDDDGDVDVYTANDSVENRYWENLGDGRFADATLLSGTGVDERGWTEAGMGIAVGDVDGDLDLDLCVTNFDDESNTLYVNDGRAAFRDRTVAAGLEAPSRLPVGFGCVLDDLDHDGDLDLAVANGHIIDNIQLFHDGKRHAQSAQLFAGDGRGHFDEVPAARAGALALPARVGRGLYSGDLDGDGDLDLLLTACGGRASLLRNDAAAGPSLQIAGAPPGSRLELELDSGRRLLRVIGANTSYFGQGQAAAHFGVDPRAVTALRLRLPQAAEQLFAAGQGLPESPSGRWELSSAPDGSWRLRAR